tara:strand:+ start:682 stop:960 length:279 start_codon:yes stop_codon:yes gene_type:complete
MMTNTNNDYNKHIEAFENHLEALWGERWEELTAKEVCKLLAQQTLGLNGGTTLNMEEAAGNVGFTSDNVVPIEKDRTFQVLTLIEFVSPTVN